MVAGDGAWNEHLGAGSLARDQAVLDHLVLRAAEPGLALGVACEFLGVLEHRLANRGDDLLAPVERHTLEQLECHTRCLDSLIHRGENTFAERRAMRGGRPASGRRDLTAAWRRTRQAFGEAGGDGVHLLVSKEVCAPPGLAHVSASPLRYFSSPSISQLSTIAMTTASTGLLSVDSV